MSDPRDYDHEIWGPRKDSWSVPKPIVKAAAWAVALVAIGGAWKTFNLPMPAMQYWVLETIEPYRDDSLRLLQVRRRLALAELFQWESNTVMNDNIRLNIEELKQEIAAIDRQIAARTR